MFLLKDKVSSHECKDARPSSKEVCSIPCENDCVVSQWSAWSDCSKNCGAKRFGGYRERTKTILAEAQGKETTNSDDVTNTTIFI